MSPLESVNYGTGNFVGLCANSRWCRAEVSASYVELPRLKADPGLSWFPDRRQDVQKAGLRLDSKQTGQSSRGEEWQRVHKEGL